MTLFLASVRSAAEAEIVLSAGADIVDVKEPVYGALGAAPVTELASVVECVGERRLVSATIGNPPLPCEEVAARAEAVFATGADIAKIGLSSGKKELAAAARMAAMGGKIVAVILVDQIGAPFFLREISDAGLYGVMLDTRNKAAGSLLRRVHRTILADFVEEAKSAGLMSGLAGGLCLEEIPIVLTLGPDVIGFRGALCAGTRRGAMVDAKKCAGLRAAIPQANSAEQVSRLRTLGSVPI